MRRTKSDVTRSFEMFQRQGPHRWPDGSQIRESHLVLAFAHALWLKCLNDPGGAGGFIPAENDPVEVLTGASGLKDLSDRVNGSAIGRRYAKRGRPLARSEFWEQIVVALPNPSGVVWAYSPTLNTFAGAGIVERGAFVVGFPVEFTAVLEELRQLDLEAWRGSWLVPWLTLEPLPAEFVEDLMRYVVTGDSILRSFIEFMNDPANHGSAGERDASESPDDIVTPDPCIRSGCSNFAVLKGVVCRAHLLPRLRARGVIVPGKSELAEMAAAVIYLADLTTAALPVQVVAVGRPHVWVHMRVFIEQEASWELVHLALDVLGVRLADRRPFHGATALEAPVASGSDVVLHVRVGVPVAALDELQRRLESLLADVVREVAGPDAQFVCRAEPEDTSDPSSTGSDAIVQPHPATPMILGRTRPISPRRTTSARSSICVSSWFTITKRAPLR